MWLNVSTNKRHFVKIFLCLRNKYLHFWGYENIIPPVALRESLAQSVEHRTFNPGVAGSSPARFTTHHRVPSSRGLGHSPFKAATRVRIPLGPPKIHKFHSLSQTINSKRKCLLFFNYCTKKERPLKPPLIFVSII